MRIKMFQKNKTIILLRLPQVKMEFLQPSEEYSSSNNFIKIFIIRNPYYAIASRINRSGGIYENVAETHKIEALAQTHELFYQCIQKREWNEKVNKIYCLQYEDLFLNNHDCIRHILDCEEIPYTNDIFHPNQNEIINLFPKFAQYENLNPKEPPPETQHEAYRTWQLNQPFQNMNDTKKLSSYSVFEKLGYHAIIS